MYYFRNTSLHVPHSCDIDTYRWDRPIATIHTNYYPAQVALHAYDPHLVATNETDMITYVVFRSPQRC